MKTKTRSLLAAFVVLAAAIGAGPTVVINPYRYAAGGGGAEFSGGTLIHEETFEASEYDLTWVEAGTGTQNGDYASPALEGAQSLNVACSSAVGNAYFAHTAADEISIDMLFYLNSKGSGTRTIFKFTNNGTNHGIITIAGTTTFQIAAQSQSGTANACTTDIDDVTLIYLRVQYVKGTGSNAITRAGWSTVSFADIPDPLTASGARSCVSSNGTRTTQANRFIVGNDASSIHDFVIDHFKVYTVP